MNDKRDGDDRKKGRGPGGARSGGGPRRSDGKAGDGECKGFRPRARDEAAPETGERKFDKPRKPFTPNGGEPRLDRPRSDRPGTDRPRADRPRPEETGGAMRIAKRLARAGIASRRDAEGMIADGRVRLNGALVETPAITVKAADRIEIDGEALPAIERTRLWLYHKPAGLVTTNRDPEGRPTVFDRLPEDLPRVLSVGRLDISTEGLLLLTNDGGLSRTLELPATGWLRRYRVRAHGTISQSRLDELRNGIAVDGVFYGAIEATLDSEKGSNVWMTLGLREGKNREVKRILAHLGLDVNRLIRISFGPFQLGDLPEGAVREIRGRTLRDQLGERLIEESGADFDAPIVRPFSNEVVEAGDGRRKAAETATPRADERPVRSEWVSANGDGKPAGKPSRREFGQAKRDSALSRLDTKPDRERPRRHGPPRERFEGASRGGPAKRSGRDDAPRNQEKPARPRPPVGRRGANVWIAPGGRPLSEKQAAERASREERPREGGDKPFRSRGFRDAPTAAGAGDGDKPRRSAGFRSQSAGKSFGERERPNAFAEKGASDRKPSFEKKGGFEKRADPADGGKHPPRRDGARGAGGDRPFKGRGGGRPGGGEGQAPRRED